MMTDPHKPIVIAGSIMMDLVTRMPRILANIYTGRHDSLRNCVYPAL
jgi:hypothetical protein